ncbi:MAG TPA: DRTGG domain-containing protein [Bacillota bacterium]|nr:DRTGG domain-containing protein [Bacillota bacterium]HPZ21598.1 DRTGG domain-containing protein [Bacillota bacterium]HQD19462.1 DRTGG domain-containing protein [Bacillota bacterium]
MNSIKMSFLEPAWNCQEEIAFRGCLVCDVLSFAIAHAQKDQIWITHHIHPNIIAVALLKELAAVIIVGGGKPDPETVRRAEAEGIPLFASGKQAYDVVKIIAAHDKDADEASADE